MITAATNPRPSPLWRTSSTTCLRTKTMPVLPTAYSSIHATAATRRPRYGRENCSSRMSGFNR